MESVEYSKRNVGTLVARVLRSWRDRRPTSTRMTRLKSLNPTTRVFALEEPRHRPERRKSICPLAPTRLEVPKSNRKTSLFDDSYKDEPLSLSSSKKDPKLNTETLYGCLNLDCNTNLTFMGVH